MKKLVELDAAVSALDDLPMDYGRWDVDDVLHALASVPTVDAVPVVHGRWIIKDNPGTGWYRVTCSECGEDVTSTIPMIGFFPNCKAIWEHCPYCGAKMDWEDSEQHGR